MSQTPSAEYGLHVEIDALAEIICNAHTGKGCKPWADEDEAWRETYRDMARAVLAADYTRPIPPVRGDQ